MGTEYEDDDLEPFLSEVLDDTLPPRWRLGSLLYLEARETFLSPTQRATLDAARERICQVLAAETPLSETDRDTGRAPPLRSQGTLFPPAFEP